MRRIRIRHAAAMSVGTLVMVTFPATAQAATVSVPCDASALQTAIGNANTNPGSDTLNLAKGCEYVLTSALPDITDQLTIHGRGSTVRRDAAAPDFRIFTVDGTTLDLDRIILAGGQVSAADLYPSGGAIVVIGSGALDLDRSIIKDNAAPFAGGIGGFPGTTITVSRSVITGNHATNNGGGLVTDGTMEVSRSVVTDNSAGGNGGGIASDGTLTLSRTVIDSNEAGDRGGGIANIAPGTITASRIVVNGNSSTNPAGGIDNDNVLGSVTLTRSVVNGNTPTNCRNVAGC